MLCHRVLRIARPCAHASTVHEASISTTGLRNINFLDLPLELRNWIYKHILIYTQDTSIYIGPSSTPGWYRHPHPAMQTSITLV